MNALEARIPPPVVGLLCAVLAWLVADLSGASALPAQLRLSAALVLALLGLVISGAGVRAVRRAQSTLNPLKPETATALVTGGIFAYTRNPMYLGMATWLLAWAAWLGTLNALSGPAAFVLYIGRFQVLPEERALAQLFGAAFTDYRAKVRRWL